jgi:pimeloyl-ACP methyl ester carboxylesterase
MNIERLPQPGKNNLWFHYNASDAVLVFLHGVLSDSRGCWLYNDKTHPEKNCYWPDLIESDRRFNGISIYLAGYYTAPDSGPYEIRNCADEVFAALKRQDIDGHPPVLEKQRITFVCHSMGGIVARYLLEANQHEFREKRVGLVLIASPSYGSKLANSLDNLITFFNHKQSIQLQWGNWSLKDLDDRFRELKDKKRIPSLSGIELYENHFIVHYKWLPIFARKLVVSKESAGRYFGAAKQLPKTDHFSSCKPREKADLVHQYLFDFLSENGLLPMTEEVVRAVLDATEIEGKAPVSAGPLRNRHFFDEIINRAVSDLERKHRARGSDLLPPQEILNALDILFNRETFRHESLLHCTYQNWKDRLHVAYQTLEILQAYQINMDIGTSEQRSLYPQLIGAVYHYCMTMARVLFETPVDEGEVKKYIGTPEFRSHLPKEQKFREAGGVLQDMDPSWDEPRQKANEVMNALIASRG